MKINKNDSKYKNYLDMYIAEIKPILNNIDILVKSADYFSLQQISKNLLISEQEVLTIIKNQYINKLDKQAFFKIMYNGSSNICTMLKKQVCLGSPDVYSSKDISYIYNIDLKQVDTACQKLKVKVITKLTLPYIFNEIPYKKIK